jgi:hypothetical protein
VLTSGVIANPNGLTNAEVTDKGTAQTVFATGADGSVNMYDGTAWTALPALPNKRKAVSVTTAQVSADVLAVAVQADNGQVFVTNQIDAATFGPWAKLPLGTGVKDTTFPKLISSDGQSVDLAFNASNGNIYHFNAPAPAAGAALVYTGGPHAPGATQSARAFRQK